MKSKLLLCIVGLPGAGKSEAAKFFFEKKIPVVAFGKWINDFVTKNKLTHTVSVHKKISGDLRKRHGMEAMAKLNEQNIRSLFKNNNFIVVDGLRSFEEYVYLKRHLSDAEIIILAIWTDKKSRYIRIKNRATRSELGGEKRDLGELAETNLGPTFTFADYIVLNQGSLPDLNLGLSKLYGEILKSVKKAK
ncbi:hypothetical protein A3C23_05435 [Candidatus Roizmanbacteria bacterium RIFCSPHIGHO2_02_FULL_37_13b]|uniref:Dephospho-CoA kinase n=1 Tax=Candidatus Roizmanbacteria bacterium RIFCSPLOWO2_02_FULL_36_11 TaxID=1802071 RepID=A0A1F7JCG7_9BACT|nr:MAG: hypothetical protein A3C23_05435 [Candidatus Roizmanbacteria bacterium RIFCSPHIGHO2_02_FULL_37_13b]OGK53314.1 MAG: hypothetical protein A3H78_03355 [Candidatus Roizmanbacteria bacterium RIFCSPLOWO2_02_FULL_36_11]